MQAITSNLFKHAAVFTDIHFGMRNNSKQHNDDCASFVDWFIAEAQSRGCETCIFCGDYHHIRSSLNVSTLNYSVENLKKISDAFETVYFIVGNHDLFYRERRDLNSFPYVTLFENIKLIDSGILEIGNVAFVPWLIGDEWKSVKKLKSKYVFGHFELPHFMMNALVSMPDHGELNASHFKNTDYVFSGHFHKRQQDGNIHYLGSPFPHNYADVWDDDRGAMFLKWGEKPEYTKYEGPRYITIKLSNLIDSPEIYLNSNTFCKTTLDIPISYEEANFIRETFIAQYSPRELTFIQQKNDADLHSGKETDNTTVESVDQIVYNELNSVESDVIDNATLQELYQSLDC
jgi:DNA repair exonuclease SbcCD nuclease subunit